MAILGSITQIYFTSFKYTPSQFNFGKKKPDVILARNKKGVFFNISVLKSTFFQHTTIAEDLKLQFRIRECHSQKAISWISRNLPEKCQKQLVFIHIRRGDYLTWPDQDNPAVLDLDWYLKAMEYMDARINNPLFIILTDDIHYAKDVFSKHHNVVISENCQYVDLALMTQCSMGILSASSFAWWGAWFSLQNEKNYKYISHQSTGEDIVLVIGILRDLFLIGLHIFDIKKILRRRMNATV